MFCPRGWEAATVCAIGQVGNWVGCQTTERRMEWEGLAGANGADSGVIQEAEPGPWARAQPSPKRVGDKVSILPLAPFL